MNPRLRSACRILLAGLTAGVLVGSFLGAGCVAANRYLSQGYPQLALASFRSFLNRDALGAGLIFLQIEITYLCIAAALRRRWGRERTAHGANAVLWVLVATGAVLWVLRRAPWAPDVRTGRGLLMAAAVLLGGFWISRFAARHEELLQRGVQTVLRGLGGAKPAVASLIVLAGVNAGAEALADREPQSRLNVLLITIDALRADHLSAYGYSRPTSPNIDRLAREGVLFRRSISQWPKTSPSFASMMSSTYGHTNGLIRTTAQRMPDRFLTLAELLKAGGYSTAATVANVNLGRLFNFDQGFDVYREPWREADEQRRSELVTRDGLDLLRRASQEKRPFFLWLHYFDPHARYQPPKPYDGMFVNDAHFDASWRMPFQSEKRKDIGGIPTTASLGREDRIAYYVAQYDAEIREVDQQVGILLQALEERGLSGRTLVILTSDHGESLGDHNYFFEHGRFPYDDCIHVPLIVRAPGTGKPGHVVRSPVELIDLVPTVLDLAGLPHDPDAEGKSFRRLLEGEPDGGSRWLYAFSESGYGQDYQRSISSERYKLVYVPDTDDQRVMKGRELELYDLQEDPGETRNVIDARPEVAGPLEDQLNRWMAESASGDAPKPVPIDRQAEEQLRSLGYL
jgi:arylsulfatase A-like enzyme